MLRHLIPALARGHGPHEEHSQAQRSQIYQEKSRAKHSTGSGTSAVLNVCNQPLTGDSREKGDTNSYSEYCIQEPGCDRAEKQLQLYSCMNLFKILYFHNKETGLKIALKETGIVSKHTSEKQYYHSQLVSIPKSH